MRSILRAAMALCLAAAAGGCAATQSKTQAGTTQTQRKVTYQTVVGAVKAYVPGKRIVLVVGPDQIREFEIEQNAEVVGRIAVGRSAKVEFFKSSDGPERVLTIEEVATRTER